MLNRGVATVDVALNILDIDQCDPTGDKKVVALNVFRGTHHCKPSTRVSLKNIADFFLEKNLILRDGSNLF
jgi:hypothetical protein